MGMPVSSRAIIARNDPRISQGTLQAGPVAPPPVDPLPVNRKQPVGPGAALAGAGGVAAGSKPGGRGAAPMGIKRAPILNNLGVRRGVTPSWLRRPVAAGALIGG